MKQFFIILLFIQSLIVVGQNDAKRIAKDSRAFMQALEAWDFEHFLDMTYPLLFEVYEREDVLEIMKETMEDNADVKMEFLNIENTVFDTSEIYNLKKPKTKYAFVTYLISMKLTFLNESFDKESQELMIMMMQNEYMKIELLNDNSLLMNQKNMLIAINDNKTNQSWKYLNYDPAKFDLLNILPVEMVSKAKTYFETYLGGG